MAVIRSAGGIVWRPGSRGVEVLLHRSRQGEWGLPKGEANTAEPWHMAALRKVADETRCTTRILSFAGACASKEPRGLEIAFYWSMELVREAWSANTAWVRPDEAIAEIERLPERRLIARAWARRSLRRIEDVVPHGDEELVRAKQVVTEALLSA